MIDVPDTIECLAYDQGGDTGWCWMEVNLDSFMGTSLPLYECITDWECGEFDDHDERDQTYRMLKLAEAFPRAALVLERFRLRKFNRSDELLAPVRIGSMFKFAIWWTEDNRPIFPQEVAEAMTTLTDERQRRMDLWVPGKEHARDATKYCYTFLHKARNNQKMRERAWGI